VEFPTWGGNPFVCIFVCIRLPISIYLSPQFTIDPFHCPLSFSSIPISLILASPILLKKTNSIKPTPSPPVIALLILHSQTPSTNFLQSDTLQVKSPLLVNQFDSCYLLGST